MTDSAAAPAPRPAPPTPPKPAPPEDPSASSVDLASLLPTADHLDALPVREHIAVFEDLHGRIASHLDDSAR